MAEHNPLREGVSSGELVDGRYRVISRIGSGGMADVHCAEDQQLGRRVALKVLYRRFAEDSEFVERFRREASAAAGLQHPNVVQVFDRGAWDGTYYIAMEFLEGRSLKQLVREDGPLDPTLAVDLTVQVLRAARFAHKRGIIHRDIKPHNVIVDYEGRVKVTDFGIARAGASDMTETGAIMGTAAYLSPEQAQGHAVSAASDLYSIGIMLYELLTGQVPFDAESAVTIALKQVSEEPLPPRALNPAVSPELEDVVLRALQKDPMNRFADADAFIEALEAVRDLPAQPGVAQRTGSLTGVYPALADGEGPYGPYEDEPDRSWRRAALVLIVLLALAAIGIGAYLLLRPQQLPVPKVVGLKEDVAAARLNNEGFEVDIQDVRSADRPSGEVIRQRPSPGEKADKGSRVTIFVSSGPGQAEVPDVTGAKFSDAKRAVVRRGFRVDIAKQTSDIVPTDHVIETRPSARTQLDIGRTVTLVVSTGRQRVAVPAVSGLDSVEARSRLQDAGLKADVIEQESAAKPAGTVLAQNPTAGTELRKGDTVTLTVAKEPSQVAVPDLGGQPVNDALDALSQAGFIPAQETKPVTTPDQDGIVIDQRPAAGAKRKKGSKVTLVVGRFDASATPTPTATPGLTPTPTPTP
ncbi:MAG: eukaryotic-like serine/threonine-protein kinase [Solirubrobacteraceae bacterium]|nr:eukaryotic-like serine/threonine-protein kinase [Solirubrobacteraceae bacterium]